MLEYNISDIFFFFLNLRLMIFKGYGYNFINNFYIYDVCLLFVLEKNFFKLS